METFPRHLVISVAQLMSTTLVLRSYRFFIGAPHKGLQTTALETLAKSEPPEDMIRELEAESPSLADSNDKVQYIAEEINILTCYKFCKTKIATKVRSLASLTVSYS